MSMLTAEQLQHQKILILGYGANHTALVGYLLRQGYSFTIRDANPIKEAEFLASWSESGAERVKWETVPDILANLKEYSVIFRSPSLSYFSKELTAARKRGALVTSQTQFFLKLCPAKVVGVTGTKGKGTTSSLIAQILEAGYEKGRVFLGGNIGVDPFTFLEEVTEHDVVVLELSSFQLEDATISPHIAVVLRVSADHLDHHESLQAYREAKAGILLHQTAHDVAIINADYPEMEYYAGVAKGEVLRVRRHTAGRQSGWVDNQDGKEVIFYQRGEVLDSFELPERQLLGGHNLENIIAAVLVGVLFDIPGSMMAPVISSFTGLPHRLSLVPTRSGVKGYDDSIATNPEACAVALAAMPADARVHLFAGGRDKGQVYKELVGVIASRCASVTLLPGKATPSLERELKSYLKHHTEFSCTIFHTNGETPFACMEHAVQQLAPHLQEGDCILLSPAAASDAPFYEYKARGDAFTEALSHLKKEGK